MADDDNTTGTTDDAQGGIDTSNDTQDASGDTGTSTDTSDTSSSNDKPVTQADLDAVVNRMKAADRRATEAENKLKEIARKDQSELERAQNDVQELTKRTAELIAALDAQALENAFLTSNKYTWHDPKDALALLDREGVEVKDGKVTGLEPAIAKLAKAKPHLIKPETGNGGGDSSSGASGSPNNGTRKGDAKKPAPDLSKRFPALSKKN
jgi:hypothetical protein